MILRMKREFRRLAAIDAFKLSTKTSIFPVSIKNRCVLSAVKFFFVISFGIIVRSMDVKSYFSFSKVKF